MDAKTTSLEEFLRAVLRGAAKILGCSSTNLILINEKSQEIRIRLGTMATSGRVLAQIERVIGVDFNGLSIPVRQAQDSLVYRAWRERSIRETSSLSELVGSAIPRLVVTQVARIIGEHRFICVPALSATRSYGVLLLEKEGRHPFNRQQREVILRYARRIGEILENDLMGQGQQLVSRLPDGGPDYVLLDEVGRVLGQGPGQIERPEVLAELGARSRALLDGGAALDAAGDAAPRSAAGDAAGDAARNTELLPFALGGARCLLAVLHRRSDPRSSSLENQLLQLTLGDAVPALFVDTELHITSCNEATRQVLGYEAAELVGGPVSRLFRDRQEIVRILSQQILDAASPYCEEQAVIVRRDGAVAPARVEVLLLADEQQQAVGFLILVREAAEDATRDGERLVRQERLATMGEMAAQLAHETRNPLVAIGATLETLLRDAALTEDHRATLTAVRKEIVRLDMTLKDYLAFRHDLAFAEVEVAAVVEDARRLLEGAYRLAGKRVSTLVTPGLTARADYEALKHVLFNLLLNALEASPQDSEVTCRAEARERDVSIHIEDRGPGLVASAAECCRPFFTTKPNGTGLGLSVCEKIARAHGGLIDLRNREGGGCRASLILPRRYDPAARGVEVVR